MPKEKMGGQLMKIPIIETGLCVYLDDDERL
jgi:hypothetical protein